MLDGSITNVVKMCSRTRHKDLFQEIKVSKKIEIIENGQVVKSILIICHNVTLRIENVDFMYKTPWKSRFHNDSWSTSVVLDSFANQIGTTVTKTAFSIGTDSPSILLVTFYFLFSALRK